MSSLDGTYLSVTLALCQLDWHIKIKLLFSLYFSKNVPFLVLLRALPDADSQVSGKEHVQECGDLVGHLETKSLANHYVP